MSFRSTIVKFAINYWPALLALLVGLYLVTLNLTGTDFTFFPGDMGDARFNMYILEHAHKYFSGDLSSYWNAPFLYPVEDIIAWSDNLLGTAPLYSIFRWSGASVETAFQGWFVLMAILNFLGAFCLLNYTVKNKYAASLGAYVFAFSLCLQSQMSHAQVFPRFAIPLAILFAIMFFKDLKPKYFFLSVFFVVYQFYCGIYLGLMLAIFMLVLFLVFLVDQRKEIWAAMKKLKWLGFMAGGLLANVLLLYPLMKPYAERSSEGYLYVEIIHAVPTMRSYFFSQRGSLLWDSLADVGIDYRWWWDHNLFPGAITMLSLIGFVFILLLGLIKKNWASKFKLEKRHLLFGLAGLVTLLLFFRYQGVSLYKFVHMLPGFSAVRGVQRIINIEVIFFGLSVAFMSLFIFRWLKKYAFIGFFILVVFLAADNFQYAGYTYRTYKPPAQERLDLLTEKMQHIPEGSIVSYEPAEPNEDYFIDQIDAMLVSQRLNLVSVNGYTGKSPPGYKLYWNNPTTPNRIYWFNTQGIKPDTVFVVP